jgi:guanylate kinase
MSPAAPSLPFHTRRNGILFLISAPSGAGKSTLLNGIRDRANCIYSVSCTTRAPRPGERNGTDYHFLSREKFEHEIAGGHFLEWAQVHGNYYGTLSSSVKAHLARGTDVLIDVDVQGARTIRGCGDAVITQSLVDVFLTPPSMEVLTRRLSGRGTESPEQLALRLQNAEREMECWRDYAYLLVSGDAEEDQRLFLAIMESERMRSARLFSATNGL